MSDTVYDSFYPLTYLDLFFCLTRTAKVGNTYKFHPWSIFFGILNMILLPASLLLYYFTHQQYSQQDSSVYFWSFRLFNWALLFRLLCIYIMRLWTHRKETRLYAAVDEFDRQMIALGKNKEISAANKYLVRFNIAAIPISLVTYILGEVYTNAIENTEIAWFIIISRFMGSYVGLLAKFQFYLWCTALKDRFIMVNDLMRKVKEKFQLNNMFVVSVYKYEQCIEKYGDLHRDLTHMARQMNAIYQFDLLWHFAIMFMIIFTNGYYMTYMMLRETEDAKPVAMVSNSLYISIEIVLNILSSTMLCNESYKAMDIFNNLKVDPDDSSTQRLVISSIFEFKENRLEITACRFFNVNFSTLAVMGTIITNYVFILIQFEDTNKTGDKNSTTTMTALTPYEVQNY